MFDTVALVERKNGRDSFGHTTGRALHATKKTIVDTLSFRVRRPGVFKKNGFVSTVSYCRLVI